MRPTRGVLVVVLLGMLSIAATRFVAMRVEIEPVRPEGTATAAILVVQVAPEDRARIGRSGWLEGEIRRGDAVVARLARAAELDATGAVRLEMVLEPGSYEVKVELRSGSGRDSGIWEGTLRVPRLERAVEPTPPTPPRPRPTPEPPPAVAAPAAAAAGGGQAAAPEVASPVPEVPAPAAEPTEPPVVREAAPQPVEVPAPPAAAPVPTGWAAAQAGLADLTVIVTDRDRPVLGLGGRDFELEVAGDPVVPEAVGGSGEAPLMLGFAVDTSASMAEELAEVRALAGRLSLRTSGGRGQVMLVRADEAPRVAADWGASSEELAAALTAVGTAEKSKLAALVTTALARFDGRTGRRVLLVVVDGGDSSSRAEWKEAADAAEGAGIPVLVIGFKGEALDDRTRSALERVADLSGGKDYWLTLRDTGLLSLVSEHFGDLLDASYAIRVRRPAGGQAEKLKVETLARGLDVRHSRKIR